MSLHKHQFYLLTRYFVNNYTPERYRNWKKYGMLVLSFYLILIFCIVDITSNLLIIYTVQNLIIYFIIDIIEHDKFMKFIDSINNKPKHVIYGELNIIDDYYNIDETKYRIVEEEEEGEYIKIGLDSKKGKSKSNSNSDSKNNDSMELIDTNVNNEIISYVHSDKNNINHRNHTIEHKATGNLQNSKKIDTRVKVLGKKKGKIEFVIVDDFNKELKKKK